jgi:PAS domain S-box-containing protein
MWMSGQAGLCIYVNPAWCELAGMSAADALGAGWDQSVYWGDRDHFQRSVITAVLSKSPIDIEYRLCRPDESFRWVLSSAWPYFDGDGAHEAYVGSTRPVEALQLRSIVLATGGEPPATPEGCLTPRERQVLGWIAKGKTNEDIAGLLAVSSRAIEADCRTAAMKLGTVNRVQTVVEAIRRGEIPL